MLTIVKELLAKRIAINDEDDYNIEKSRERLIELLSKNETETISILNQLSEMEIMYVSEVFEEIAYNLQSEKFILCLKEIQKKYENIDIEDAIEVAEEYI